MSRGLLGGDGDCACPSPPRRAADARKAKCAPPRPAGTSTAPANPTDTPARVRKARKGMCVARGPHVVLNAHLVSCRVSPVGRKRSRSSDAGSGPPPPRPRPIPSPSPSLCTLEPHGKRHLLPVRSREQAKERGQMNEVTSTSTAHLAQTPPRPAGHGVSREDIAELRSRSDNGGFVERFASSFS